MVLCNCCNLSSGVALIVWFIMNGMCAKNNTMHICGANKQQKSDHGVEALPILTCERLNVTTSVRGEWSWHVNFIVACCHSRQCEALRIRRSGFPIATQRSTVLETSEAICQVEVIKMHTKHHMHNDNQPFQAQNGYLKNSSETWI